MFMLFDCVKPAFFWVIYTAQNNIKVHVSAGHPPVSLSLSLSLSLSGHISKLDLKQIE